MQALPVLSFHRVCLYATVAVPPSKTPRTEARIRLGKRIEQCRVAKGLSFKEAALLLGVKWQSWQQWESGRTSPRPEKLANLASVLGVSLNQLLGIGFETTFGGPTDEAPRTLQRNYDLAREWVDQQQVRDGELPRHREAMLQAYIRLPPEIRYWIRGLIETLDHRARQNEVPVRKKDKIRGL